MVGPPLIFDLPALPMFRRLHALAATRLEALGPLFGRSTSQAQCLVELFRYVVHVLFAVVLCDFDASGRRGSLQRIGRNIVVIVSYQGERQGGSKGRGRRKEEAGVLQLIREEGHLRSGPSSTDLPSGIAPSNTNHTI